MASPRFDVSPSSLPSLDVYRLDTEAAVSGDAESVVMVKLTDEMIAAIQSAQRANTPMRISIQPQGGVIVLGGEKEFRFSSQSLPGPPADVVASDKGHGYRATATVHTKYQVQATNKSFEETREKAKKLIEQENSRAAKDVSRQPRDQRAMLLTKRMAPASTASSRSPYLKPVDSNQRASPSSKLLSSASTACPVTSAAPTSSGARPSMSPNLKADLMRRKLRVRIVHLIVTGRFPNADEVYKKLKRDGLSDKDDDKDRVLQTITDVSERTADGRLMLKPALFGEVDSRWPWFTTEEKATVRRAVQPSTTSGFAPVRKSGIDRVHAPSQLIASDLSRKEHEASPSSVASQSTVGPIRSSSVGMVGNGKKVNSQSGRSVAPPAAQVAKPQSPLAKAKDKTPVSPPLSAPDNREELVPVSAPFKRKAHVPVSTGSSGSGAVAEKRSRPNPTSPPLTSTKAPLPSTNRDVDREKENRDAQRALATSAGSTGGSSVSSSGSSSGVSSRLSSPTFSLSSPSQPSQDWSKLYSEAKTVNDAEKYYQMFCDEYPEYMQCFSQLNKVSAEFRGLGEKLERARKSKSGDDADRVERNIHARYADYEKDVDFLRIRQRHADLRCKLDVLKRRISAWERREEATRSESLFTL